MISTVLIVLLFGLSVWLYLGGPMPNLLPKKTREELLLNAWLILRRQIDDQAVRQKLDELLPLLLKEKQQ